VTPPARAGSDAAALAPDWSRLHPLSPVVQFGRAIGVLVIVVVPRILVSHSGGAAYSDVAIVGVGLLVGAVHWLVTRWRVTNGELQIETGLLRRQSIRVPLANIQSVDVVRPGLARLFGLSEVRVESAGAGTAHGRLAYLPEERAVVVRAQLLALAHGLDENTPEPPELALWQVDNGRLVASALVGLPALLLAALIVTVVALGASGAGQAAAAVSGACVPVAIVLVSVIARRVLAEYGFRIGGAGDGLRLRSGLIQIRAQTIPFGRVQALRCTQPLLWRPLGWVRVEVDMARQRHSGRRGSESDSQLLSRALIPVGHAPDAALVVTRVLPGASLAGPPRRPPRRALLKAPLSYWASSVWHDDAYLVARTGRFAIGTTIVPLDKVQSVRWSQGPLQRRLRLATVHVDVAGRSWTARAKNRDVDESRALLADLAERAGHARRHQPAQGRRAP
jgi:putative membrane protein